MLKSKLLALAALAASQASQMVRGYRAQAPEGFDPKNIGQPFQDTPCTVIVTNNYDTQGVGSLTRASISSLTPAQLQTLFAPSGLFADMDAWFRTSFEMKACGIKTNGMYEWVMSSMRRMGNLLNSQKVDKGPSLLFPFVLGRQDSVVNIDYWAITNGWSVTTYGGLNGNVNFPLTNAQLAEAAGTDRVIRVVTRYGVDMNAEWFAGRDVVYIWNTSGGQTLNGNWKVIDSAIYSVSPTFVDVIVTSQNAASATAYDPAPTGGVLVRGGNNVNDFESYCQNRPTLNPRKRVPYWYQTQRKTRRVDQEYMKVFARLMESNRYFQEFGDLPLAERNRQDEEAFQKAWLYDFFYGKPISANQTLANWQSLQQITTITSPGLDPGLGGKLVAYRANMIGVFEQLQACGRVRDYQNTPINIYVLLEEIYRIVRARKSQGRTADSIDIYTDNQYSALFQTAMFNYYRQEYGDTIRIPIETGTNELGFAWTSFKVKFPAGVSINLITHEFFDDRRTALAAEGMDYAMLMILDLGRPGVKGGTIYPGMIATNTKKRTLGELEKLAAVDPTFSCVMEYTTEEIMLSSETTTCVCECPANSAWLIGIQPNVVPLTTTPSTNYVAFANLY